MWTFGNMKKERLLRTRNQKGQHALPGTTQMKTDILCIKQWAKLEAF